jgi:hypothetical protein
MAAPRGAASVALLALAVFAALVALPLRGGRSLELSSTGSDVRPGAARQKELTKMEECSSRRHGVAVREGISAGLSLLIF